MATLRCDEDNDEIGTEIYRHRYTATVAALLLALGLLGVFYTSDKLQQMILRAVEDHGAKITQTAVAASVQARQHV